MNHAFDSLIQWGAKSIVRVTWSENRILRDRIYGKMTIKQISRKYRISETKVGQIIKSAKKKIGYLRAK